VQQGSSAGYVCKSDVRVVLKMVGEFLKPVRGRSRLTVVVPLTGGPPHWKAKMGLLTGANWMQKNASFESKHEKQFVSAGVRASKVYGLGTTECRATAA
jgi:hypothetical protein